MRRETIPLGDGFLTLTLKSLIVSKPDYILMICKNCAYLKSSYVIATNITNDQYNFLQYKMRQMPKCTCLEEQSGGTNSDK